MKKPLGLVKKIFAVTPVIVLGTTLAAQAQGVTSPIVKPARISQCCMENPWALTTGAHSIMEAFGDLLLGKGIKDCNKDADNPKGPIPNLAYTMPAKHYNGSANMPGVVTFVAFYQPKIFNEPVDSQSPDHFRIIWNTAMENGVKDNGGFLYYGVCIPEPNIAPAEGNHVFAFKLFPIDRYQNYKAAKPKDFAMMAGVRPADISQILSVSVESKNGYIASTEKANYDNPRSSKGIVVLVRLKSTKVLRCYLINNYDGATVTWKQPNTCRGL